MIPLVIPTPGGDCFAIYHPAHGPGMLVCPPFGNEASRTGRVWRDVACRLAACGIASLRPDLPGTGDAGEMTGTHGQVVAWRDAVAACAEWLAARHGGRVCLLGHRFGSLLALDAVARGLEVERLVLLDPPTSGAAFARSLHARSRLEGHGPTPEGPDHAQAWEAVLAPGTLRDLGNLPAPLAGTVLPPTLVVSRDGGADEWSARLGTPVAFAPFDGYAAFVPPNGLDMVAPVAVLDGVVGFLAPTGGGGIDGTPAARLPMPAGIRLPALHEVPIRFGRGDGLFGLICRPDRPAPDAPAVLMPTVGADPRSGTARHWTELARRLALGGVTSLRFDVAGVGESDGDEPVERIAASYHPDRVADLRAALDALGRWGHHRAVVVGQCSGGYTGWHAAGEDARIVGLLAANPQFLSLQTDLSKAALFRYPGAGVRPVPRVGGAADAPHAVRGRGVAVLPQALGDRARRACPRSLRLLLRRMGTEERATRRHLRALLRRGCAVHFVFSGGDHGYLRLCRAFGEPPRLPRGASLSVIEGADHNFSTRRHRARLLDLAVTFAKDAASTGAIGTPWRPSRRPADHRVILADAMSVPIGHAAGPPR